MDAAGSKLLAANLVYGVAVVAWVGAMSCILFLPLWYFNLLYVSLCSLETSQGTYLKP